ncbi:hypothetical protein MTR67_027529 [Solanum verrucosum]|uniref:DUF4218 domain-containing protein n=1 Tax=Solanum verrucosum TaxID=315347 RepID=A0AAF0R9S5_SOLVR|nr:hypothetical protein MTR67_027529 [Solanum verrucosum]
MDVKGKTKDNPKARMDIKEYCRRKELWLQELQNGKIVMPKASFSFTLDEKREIIEWVKNLRMPKGYASNLGKRANMNEGKLIGMKSHVFMETLIPIAFSHLPERIWKPITEISLFFKDLCSGKLLESSLDRMEENIFVTTTKLEKIFPCDFFDVMEHLSIHLVQEARLGGPVQTRWMYPFERDKAHWWVVIKSKSVGRIEIDNVLDVVYQNYVTIVQQQVDVELESTLQHPQHILEETKHAKKKKSRRPIDPEDIAGSISSAPERISHDTHLFAVPFGTADPRQYYPNYRRPVGASSTSQALPSRRHEDLPLFVEHDPYWQSDAMAGTPPLTQRFVHPDVSPSSTAAPSATPHDTMFALAPGQKDILGRVMIEPDRSSWHPAKDAARALKECVRRLYTEAYHSWSEIPNSIRQAMFNNFKYSNTDKFKAISNQAKMARDSLKGGSLHTKSAKMVGTIAREMEKELGRTPIEPEVFKKTHVRKKENESDPDVWVEERAERTFIWKEKVVGGTRKGRCYGLGSRNDVRRLQSGLEGIGSSHQTEALDGIQIAAMSDQITKLTAALAESERKRVAEQQSISETVQQIKEQVMNLARRPTTSAPDDTDNESDEDDYVDLTP